MNMPWIAISQVLRVPQTIQTAQIATLTKVTSILQYVQVLGGARRRSLDGGIIARMGYMGWIAEAISPTAVGEWNSKKYRCGE
jgi:hypothetical protein